MYTAGHGGKRVISRRQLFGEERVGAPGSTASDGAARMATTASGVVAVIPVALTRSSPNCFRCEITRLPQRPASGTAPLVTNRRCYYGYYMEPIELKVARIGNSRGVRLPAKTLKRYAIDDRVIMEETADGILLRPRREPNPKLSWEETARAMAVSAEDWSEWNITSGDGLADITWHRPPLRQVAEPKATYELRPTKKLK